MSYQFIIDLENLIQKEKARNPNVYQELNSLYPFSEQVFELKKVEHLNSIIKSAIIQQKSSLGVLEDDVVSIAKRRFNLIVENSVVSRVLLENNWDLLSVDLHSPNLLQQFQTQHGAMLPIERSAVAFIDIAKFDITTEHLFLYGFDGAGTKFPPTRLADGIVTAKFVEIYVTHFIKEDTRIFVGPNVLVSILLLELLLEGRNTVTAWHRSSDGLIDKWSTPSTPFVTMVSRGISLYQGRDYTLAKKLEVINECYESVLPENIILCWAICGMIPTKHPITKAWFNNAPFIYEELEISRKLTSAEIANIN